MYDVREVFRFPTVEVFATMGEYIIHTEYPFRFPTVEVFATMRDFYDPLD